MYLSRLRLHAFRNLEDQTLELPPGGVALIGDNGQGKTNLLEAVYYLEIFRSFRGAPDEQLVRFGEEVFRVEGRMRAGDGTERTIAAAFERRRKRKKVTVNGAEPERIGEAIGGVGATIFSPSDVEIVAGSPSGRRRFLDIVLSLAVPGYLAALQRYRQVLFQRNALLRQGAGPAMVAAWNDGLVAWGSRVAAARAAWVAEVRDGFAEHYARVAGGPRGALAYAASVGEWRQDTAEGGAAAAVAEAFRAGLERAAEREVRRGMTLVGPHRDDLRFEMERPGADPPLDLRTYGSGGQQRTAAVALRMVEAETIRASRGRDPVILLDDVFAELDPGRSLRIIEWIDAQQGGQVILTSPKPSDVEVHGGALPRWEMRGGRVRTG
ncbi:MAG TPA: DNA replication and repair protein RecF [Longimicrobiaceae bacterium]|nr:DNA replication and repair protein RecF [Longimicrobiaceae bacterium]